MFGLLLLFSLSHPLVVVDGEGSCPAPAAVQEQVAALIPPVDEREPQDRAVIERVEAGLSIDLRRDDGERLAQRVLSAAGNCGELAAAAAVIIAAWEAHLKPGLAGRVSLPAEADPGRHAGGTAGLEGRLGLVASFAGGSAAPGASLEGTLRPGGGRIGLTLGASYAAERSQAVADVGARWRRVAFSAGAQYRWHPSAQTGLDLHVDGLIGVLRVEGFVPGADGTSPANWSSHADLSTQLGVGAGARAFRAWRSLAGWVGLGVLAWPGHQRLYVQGAPAATGEIPAIEGQLTVGVAWGRFL